MDFVSFMSVVALLAWVQHPPSAFVRFLYGFTISFTVSIHGPVGTPCPPRSLVPHGLPSTSIAPTSIPSSPHIYYAYHFAVWTKPFPVPCQLTFQVCAIDSVSLSVYLSVPHLDFRYQFRFHVHFRFHPLVLPLFDSTYSSSIPHCIFQFMNAPCRLAFHGLLLLRVTLAEKAKVVFRWCAIYMTFEAM